MSLFGITGGMGVLTEILQQTPYIMTPNKFYILYKKESVLQVKLECMADL
jgi:hypothetical protein